MLTYWVEITIYILLSVVIATLAGSNIYLSFKIRKVYAKFAQATLDNVALREKLAELTAKGEYKKLEQTEGFVKFISESRAWAFDYIEDAQKAIAELKDYFDMVGFTDKEEERAEMLDRINHLASLLPKDAKND